MKGSNFQFNRGQILLAAGTTGPLWRVTKGAFRLERPGTDGQPFVQLALAGDLVGVEHLCAEPYAYTAVALMNSQACMQRLDSEMARYKVMAQGFMQQQRRALDMIQLRTGSISGRIGHLLKMLGRQTDGRVIALDRKGLPTLNELALIVDSAPETVCRELKAFMPARPRQPLPPLIWRGVSSLSAVS